MKNIRAIPPDFRIKTKIYGNTSKKGGFTVKDLKGSRTEANLMAAYAGESQARTKYTIYAEKAKKDGYQQIGAIFSETAENERAHAEIWLKLLHNGIPNTENALKDAAGGEHYEWSDMYPQFAEEARAEGFDHIAVLFDMVAKIEQEHEKRFQKLIGNLAQGLVFSKEGDTVWICRNCGHLVFGKGAPAVCPVCKHEQAYFQVKAENY